MQPRNRHAPRSLRISGKQRSSPSGSTPQIPMSPKPGVSATRPPHSNSRRRALTVVCRPRRRSRLSSPVRSSRPGWTRFRRLDFPTPDGPTRADVPEQSTSASSSTPRPDTALVGITRYPIGRYTDASRSTTSVALSRSTLLITRRASRSWDSPITRSRSIVLLLGSGRRAAATATSRPTFAATTFAFRPPGPRRTIWVSRGSTSSTVNIPPGASSTRTRSPITTRSPVLDSRLSRPRIEASTTRPSSRATR